MNEPRRYLDELPSSPASRLLRAAAEQPIPSAVLARAARRFGVSAAAVSATSVGLAKAAVAPALASSGAAVAGASGSAVFGSASVVFVFVKALAMGLGIGAAVLGTAHWALPVESARKPATLRAVVASPSAQRPTVTALEPAVRLPERAASRDPSLVVDVSMQTRQHTEPVTRDPAGERRETAPSEVPTARSAGRVLSERSEANPVLLSPEQVERQQPQALPSVGLGEQSLLANEVRALDEVRAALGQGDARRALLHLDDSARRQVFRLLSRDALVLKVEALGKVGQRRDAAILASQLLEQPVSPAQRRILEHWLGSR